MGAILAILAPLVTNFIPSLKDWFDYKQKVAESAQELKLATIRAQAKQMKAQIEADSAVMQVKLGATSTEFKQYTSYFLLLPLVFSILLPSKAAVMWHNFELIPEWFRTLFGAVYLTIWGIPVAASYIGGIFNGIGATVGSAIVDRREYKIEKIKALNEAAVFSSLRKSIFHKGLTQDQVEAVQKALKAGQE